MATKAADLEVLARRAGLDPAPLAKHCWQHRMDRAPPPHRPHAAAWGARRRRIGRMLAHRPRAAASCMVMRFRRGQ